MFGISFIIGCQLVLLLNTIPGIIVAGDTASQPTEYGVDYSFPIHHYLDKKVSPRYSKFYDEKMAGCYAQFSKRECDATERARLEMNKNQPASQVNYTEIGFKKMKVPPHVWEPLLAFYEQNKNNQHIESWPRGYTYVNTWESPSYMISLEDRSLRGGLVVKQQIWDGVKSIIEEWTGKKQTPTSLYGIRVYRDKSILATHVDRLPLVSSCIINVAQDVNEPWPIEVYDHQGRAHNVTMEPGDMVLYESHTVLHGRPFPLNGAYFANVFVHFQPIDHEESNQREMAARNEKAKAAKAASSMFTNPFTATVSAHLKKNKIGGHEQDQHDEGNIKKHLENIDAETTDGTANTAATPTQETVEKVVRPLVSGAKAIVDSLLQQTGSKVDEGDEGDEEDEEERQALERQFTFDEKVFSREELLRRVAARGDLDGLVKMLKDGSAKNSVLLHSRDDNGWQAVHEAVRSGCLDCVRYLVESGADVGSKVEGGGAALWIARNTLNEDHETVAYLVEIGAPETPEADEEVEAAAGEEVKK